MILNKELMRMAREDLHGKWGLAAGTTLLYIVVSTAIGVIPGAGLIVGGALMLGYVMFTLAFVRHTEPRSSQVFDGFSNFGVSLGAYLLMFVFVFLWTLLLIIPGILAALSYAMTFYIIADNPNIGPLEALQASKKMMYGYRWKYFCLMLRFIGWGLLCIPTLMIGIFWLIPYIQVSIAEFYEDVRGKPAEEPVAQPIAA